MNKKEYEKLKNRITNYFYTIELDRSDWYKLLDYIEQLQQGNKQLKERVEYLERSNNRREDEILYLRQELADSEVCVEKAIKYIEQPYEYQSQSIVRLEFVKKILKGEDKENE